MTPLHHTKLLPAHSAIGLSCTMAEFVKALFKNRNTLIELNFEEGVEPIVEGDKFTVEVDGKEVSLNDVHIKIEYREDY